MFIINTEVIKFHFNFINLNLFLLIFYLYSFKIKIDYFFDLKLTFSTKIENIYLGTPHLTYIILI
jgi:hypothetical protein